MKRIKNIVAIINLKYRYSPKRINEELENLKEFVRKSSVYVGKKRKLYKYINSYKIKK